MDPAVPSHTPSAREAAVRVLLALSAAGKALRFYPPSNPQVRAALDRLRQALAFAAPAGVLSLAVERERFASDGAPLSGLDPDLDRLAFKLHCLNVREIVFDPAIDENEAVALAQVLNQPYETLEALGPLDGTLRSRGISRAGVRFAATIQTGRSGEVRADAPAVQDPLFRRPKHLVRLLDDPSQFARELIRRCVEIVPAAGEKRLDAQLEFVDRFLQAAAHAIEAEPVEARPDLYERLAAAVDALVRSADPSGARMGGLPRVDLSSVDPRVLAVLPQRDLVKEVSSKVKLHQGATTVMASALSQLKLHPSAEHANPVLRVIEGRAEAARSVTSNIQVLDEIRAGTEVDGEYPGIVYAERDRNKNFPLEQAVLDGAIGPGERREAQARVAELDDWRPEVDGVETILDMLFNEVNPNFFKMIADRLVEKLGEFLAKGELPPALVILRGLSAERPRRREDALNRPVLDAALARVEEPVLLERILKLAETLPIESPAFEDIKSFLFLLDKRVVHTLVDIVARDSSRYSRRRTLALTQFLCRNRVDLLAEGLRSPHTEAVRTFVWLLGRFGPPAIVHLRRAAHHPEPRVRREVARSLAAIDGEEAARALGALLQDRDEAVVQTVLRAWQTRGGPEAVVPLDAALAAEGLLDRSDETVLLSLRVASRLGQASTLERLRRLEERGRRRWMLKASFLREAARQAVRELEERLRAAPGA